MLSLPVGHHAPKVILLAAASMLGFTPLHAQEECGIVVESYGGGGQVSTRDVTWYEPTYGAPMEKVEWSFGQDGSVITTSTDLVSGQQQSTLVDSHGNAYTQYSQMSEPSLVEWQRNAWDLQEATGYCKVEKIP